MIASNWSKYIIDFWSPISMANFHFLDALQAWDVYPQEVYHPKGPKLSHQSWFSQVEQKSQGSGEKSVHDNSSHMVINLVNRQILEQFWEQKLRRGLLEKGWQVLDNFKEKSYKKIQNKLNFCLKKLGEKIWTKLETSWTKLGKSQKKLKTVGKKIKKVDKK